MTATIATEPHLSNSSLDERLAAACGQLNACYAHLVELLGEAIASGSWQGYGIRSVEHWIGWRTGLAPGHCRTLAALVAAADSHPQVVEAFSAGELSVDQAGLAVQARPEHDGDIAVWAKAMTLPQLRLAVRASNVSGAEREAAAARLVSPSQPDVPVDEAEPDPTPSSAPSCREYLSLQQDVDGSWRLHGCLDADHGTLIDAALSEARDRLFGDGNHDVTWVESLVDVAERSIDAVPTERRERFRINLFLDPANTAAATWINGMAMPEAIAGLYTCDGTISPVFVDQAHPVSVGRSQRIVPERTRRIVMHRDKQCRNPLCGATRGLEVHHIIHWIDDGTTDTWNLVALCRRCHRNHHLGRLDIAGMPTTPAVSCSAMNVAGSSTRRPMPPSRRTHRQTRRAPTATPSVNASSAGPSSSTRTDTSVSHPPAPVSQPSRAGTIIADRCDDHRRGPHEADVRAVRRRPRSTVPGVPSRPLRH